jgi:toxin YoeB
VKLVFNYCAWEDYLHWQATDPKMLERLDYADQGAPTQALRRIGKPEPLRCALSGVVGVA